MHNLPDPLSLTWPRHTARCLLRPVTIDDVDGVLAYRSDPAVTRYLLHGPLQRHEVEERIRGRMSGADPTPGRLVRGIAIVHSHTNQLIGDAMLRTQLESEQGPQLWVGYALRADAWGQGFATEVLRELTTCGAELGIPVWADAMTENIASRKVLLKAGFSPADRVVHNGASLEVFTFAQH